MKRNLMCSHMCFFDLKLKQLHWMILLSLTTAEGPLHWHSFIYHPLSSDWEYSRRQNLFFILDLIAIKLSRDLYGLGSAFLVLVVGFDFVRIIYWWIRVILLEDFLRLFDWVFLSFCWDESAFLYFFSYALILSEFSTSFLLRVLIASVPRRVDIFLARGFLTLSAFFALGVLLTVLRISPSSFFIYLCNLLLTTSLWWDNYLFSLILELALFNRLVLLSFITTSSFSFLSVGAILWRPLRAFLFFLISFLFEACFVLIYLTLLRTLVCFLPLVYVWFLVLVLLLVFLTSFSVIVTF